MTNDEEIISNAFDYCKKNYPYDHIFTTGIKLKIPRSIYNKIYNKWILRFLVIYNESLLRFLVHLCFIFHIHFVIIRFRRDLEGLDREILDVKETAWELMENIRLTGYFKK